MNDNNEVKILDKLEKIEEDKKININDTKNIFGYCLLVEWRLKDLIKSLIKTNDNFSILSFIKMKIKVNEIDIDFFKAKKISDNFYLFNKLNKTKNPTKLTCDCCGNCKAIIKNKKMKKVFDKISNMTFGESVDLFNTIDHIEIKTLTKTQQKELVQKLRVVRNLRNKIVHSVNEDVEWNEIQKEIKIPKINSVFQKDDWKKEIEMFCDEIKKSFIEINEKIKN